MVRQGNLSNIVFVSSFNFLHLHILTVVKWRLKSFKILLRFEIVLSINQPFPKNVSSSIESVLLSHNRLFLSSFFKSHYSIKPRVKLENNNKKGVCVE